MNSINLKIAAEKLQWSEGTVKGFLSKELITRQNGGFKLVKVAPNTSYPVHLHPDKTEFIYILEGNPDFEIDTTHFTGGKNDFFIFPANVKHAIHNNSGSEIILLVGSIKN